MNSSPSCRPTPDPCERSRSAESGNIIYYILLAIALLAALVFAIAQGNRTTLTDLSETQVELMASDILEYADIVSNATAQLRLRRVDFADLRFAHPDLDAAYGTYDANPAAEVFNPNGGAIRYQAPPDAAMTTPAPWIFTATNEIDGIGTTCGADSCVDLLMLARPLTQAVCVEINNILAISNPGGTPPEDSEVNDSVLFAGTVSYQATVGDESGSAPVRFKKAACVRDTGAADYVFYQTLWSR